MLFVEARFLAFFALVFVVHWALRSATARKVWLLLASVVFYGAWDIHFLSLIVASSLFDYCAALGIENARRPWQRRAWLTTSLTANLGLLGFFKYHNFFAGELSRLLAWLGLPASNWTLSIILPVGISFYTFQTLSYTLDVYFGKLPARRSLLDVALFVCFFPQLVAGPIVRAVTFLPQLDTPRRWSEHVAVRPALVAFAFGYFKKAVLSDHVAVWVDQFHQDPLAFDGASGWLSIALFQVQIYCDFSGYSDMAIGTASLLGYALPQNFAAPFLSRSNRELWRRWHITLGSWFANYLFVPLGGSHGSEARTRRNLLIVFLVSGLWHGANWTFLIWGLMHGTFVVLERGVWGTAITRLPGPLATLYVNLLFALSFLFFRIDTAGEGFAVLGRMIRLEGGQEQLPAATWWLVLFFFALHASLAHWNARARLAQLEPWKFALGFGVLAALTLPFVNTNPAPFIYFQF